MSWMPGDNEAAAAISGMRDTYGHYGPPSGFAVGERVTYRSAAGDEEARGVIVEVLDELSGQYHVKIRRAGHGVEHRFATDAELAYF